MGGLGEFFVKFFLACMYTCATHSDLHTCTHTCRRGNQQVASDLCRVLRIPEGSELPKSAKDLARYVYPVCVYGCESE